ncbi:uncharacterized protein LAESUDRAFT_717989 [Laetiporus sulphureus 93-53]|uniref:Exonuclease domain-containing protein n=1 Tax=Laetiporus sulphureus 93-53 TaxID=1314785 RepID=A0A165BCD4_9APHY|nr:uncharacterized protein LAESUDRAFT_717989 [Laetiporus sulphureus 93-53]KZT00730.1 hypothetical protein LAESUDRAFT_717989 [Laetiporus sulphureus 93-53]
MHNGDSISSLRSMIAGTLFVLPHRTQPGKYLAIDCEMFGMGQNGSRWHEICLTSALNWRVVDYRTQFSGIRPDEIVHAKPLKEAQKQVAGLLEYRILVGHTVHNDSMVHLLLARDFLLTIHHLVGVTHPAPTLVKTRYGNSHAFAPRCSAALLRQELGVMKQEGEHSNVIDAWATTAVYRLHRRDWENGQSHKPSSASQSKNRKRAEAEIDSRRKKTDGGEEDEGSIADDSGIWKRSIDI